MGCNGVTWWAVGAWAVLLIGLCLHTAGFATEGWMYYETSSAAITHKAGFFSQTYCNTGTCTAGAVDSKYSTAPLFTATMALVIVALVAYVIVFPLSTSYVLCRGCRTKTLSKVTTALCFLEVVLAVIALIIFIVFVNQNTPFTVFFSFGMVAIATTCTLLAAIMMLFEVRENKNVTKMSSRARDRDDDIFYGH